MTRAGESERRNASSRNTYDSGSTRSSDGRGHRHARHARSRNGLYRMKVLVRRAVELLRPRGAWALGAAVVLAGVMASGPLIAVVVGSLMGTGGFTLAAYVEVLVDTPAFHVLFANSTALTAGVLAGQLLLAPPAAWALARYRFPGRNMLFFLYVLLMMLPFQVLMLPSYLMLNALGINGTLLAIVLPGAFSAFPVFIMEHFFAGIPDELIESARLDGASELRIFVRIGLPLGTPGIFASLVLGFFECWSMVEQPLAFLRDQALWPLSLFQPAAGAEGLGVAFAAAAVAAVPALLVFLLGKDYLEAGIASTTRKDG